MNDAERKYDVTDRDLFRDFDESKLDRIGKPLGVEQHDAGQPDAAPATGAKATHTLIDMSQDFEFFTTAVIHAATVFDRDPLIEYNKLHHTPHDDELPLLIEYAGQFFTGLGVCLVAGIPVNLDCRLYAIVRHRWDKLRDTICGMAMMHRQSGFYARLNLYELELVDPFALRKMAVIDELPKIPITVFGVSSNKSFSYIQPATYPKLPRLVNEPPKADMLVEGRGVLEPPPAPETLLPQAVNRK